MLSVSSPTSSEHTTGPRVRGDAQRYPGLGVNQWYLSSKESQPVLVEALGNAFLQNVNLIVLPVNHKTAPAIYDCHNPSRHIRASGFGWSRARRTGMHDSATSCKLVPTGRQRPPSGLERGK
jgi:hypothetical protein